MVFVVVSSGKGGVTKTTTAVNLARGLAYHGKRTLLVDFDPLGQCSTWMGQDPAPGIYDLLVRGVDLQAAVVSTTVDNLYLLPGNSDTKVSELVMAMRSFQARDVARDLKRILAEAEFDPYAYVVMDTAPAGLMQEVGLVAADVTVVPATLDYLGGQGVAMLMALRHNIGQQGPALILPAMYDKRLKRHQEMMISLESYAQEQQATVAGAIPLRDEMREIAALATTVYDHQARSHHGRALEELRRAYEDLVARVMETGEELCRTETRLMSA